jgi:F0F1-type ATP synthase assembly protein I
MPDVPPRPQLWRFVGIGAEFFSPIMAGAIGGYYLDEHYRTTPVIALVGLLLGIFLGFYRLVAELKQFQKGV